MMSDGIDDKRQWTEAAIRFAKSGGEVVMDYFRREVTIRDKGTGNLVSDADLNSERTIVEMITEAFPGLLLSQHEAVVEFTLRAGAFAVPVLFLVIYSRGGRLRS